MKVRIQGNSLRFRLKQFEVEAFKQHHFVKEEVVFGQGSLSRLQFILCAAAAADIQINYGAGKVTVSIPLPVAEEWTGTDMVGMEEKVKLDSGEVIRVLIEKDFKCLDGREEENTGSYPNPMEAC